ncbi:MAG: hypothetical protein AUJ85_07550 [Elusimicrobia bacterium CG1_02_37_114]|nr:MAG: hypothetical protein AUJ85_07550 [Elusimicrobia bacterium CG1_02_37_114]PIV53218.1 MAG: pathogenicity locus [Elusimicrobia bacterium CG02_land_8_20_14_3_00_37_13]PIZ14192.1 MAG: pathogenicity locus [Elusimicrobia bacterium CG_4_10_14_0_8_um_filter_37_32]
MKKSKYNTSDLLDIPGVGINIAKDLRDLDVYKVEHLHGKNPEVLYKQLCDLRRCRIDRCVLYVFRCAVYFAEHKKHNARLLKWWNWKDQL